jgi:PAS domain S-box-containing protein
VRARHIPLVALILGLTVTGFLVARALTERDARRDSERRAEVAVAQIRSRIEQATSLTGSLGRYMLDAGGTGVTSDQFARTALRWLSPAKFPAAAWAEQVPAADRAEYERRTGQPIVTPDERSGRAPTSSSYLPATLVSGFTPLDLRGVDLRHEPGIASALFRASRPGGVAATPVTGGRTQASGLFVVAPAPNLIDGVLRPGAVVVFVPEATLRASAGAASGLRLISAGRSPGAAGGNTVRKGFFAAGRSFTVVMPKQAVGGPVAILPWIILAAGLVLTALATRLGVVAGRRARAQAELDRIFDLSSDLIAVADFEGHFTRVNPAVEQILGYTREEFLALPYLDLVHPDDREKTAAEAADIARGKQTLSFENRYRHKNGAYRVLEWTATPVLEDGLMYGVARDVTARRHAEAEREALAKEQAALRRVATLVASGGTPNEIFAAVGNEVRQLVGNDLTSMFRCEPGDILTLVAVRARTEPVPDGLVGARIPIRGQFAEWLETGRLVRLDARKTAGWMVDLPAAEPLGLKSAIGAPIVVGGRPWGAIFACDTKVDGLPQEAERPFAQFTELVATALANAQARSELSELASEQAALRRVAELVAREAPQSEVFAAIAKELRQLLRTEETRMMRYSAGREAVVVGKAGDRDIFPSGSRWPLEGQSVTSIVFRTGKPARIEDYGEASGPVAEAVRAAGLRAVVGTPIVVEGRLWGAMLTGTVSGEPLPPDTESRIGQFTELIATAIANAEAREEVERLADEQAALRRVATVVARGGSRREVFNAVAEEMRQLIGADFIDMLRYEDDRTAVSVASGGAADEAFAVGSRHELGGDNATSLILRTRQPVRIDNYDRSATGPIAETARPTGIRSVVGAPLVVDGRLWGAVTIGTTGDEPLPPDTEARLGQFVDLMATAIANTEARAEVERLADEQAALRRVATLVAQGASAGVVLDAVAAEMERLLGADGVAVGRYESRDQMTVVAHRGPEPQPALVGTRMNFEGHNISALVRRTGRPVRLEDLSEAPGGFVDVFRRLGSRALVGTPIVVEGRLWGTIVASWNSEAPPPADTEEHMARFAELLETAIANADSRNQLTASRARLVTAGDEARRRVVRDLHDGAQQRLVHTIVTLKLAQRAFENGDGDGNVQALVGEALEQAERSNTELRELAHGILPPALTRGGLRAGVDTLVQRIDLPVEIEIPDGRFPAEIEASAYFVIAEALTNVMKHAHAKSAKVMASVKERSLCIEVRDDGIGGADADGHGLVGVNDRVSALGGRLEVKSPAGDGTLLSATLPLSAG